MAKVTAEEVVTEVAVEEVVTEVAVGEVVSMSITPHRQILTSSHTDINIYMTCKRLRMLHWWVWAGWTDGHGAARIAGGLCMNELHCRPTYHVFYIFICLLF